MFRRRLGRSAFRAPSRRRGGVRSTRQGIKSGFTVQVSAAPFNDRARRAGVDAVVHSRHDPGHMTNERASITPRSRWTRSTSR
jgi:hypothetical protein